MLSNNLDLLLPQRPADEDQFYFGTVTSVSPLMVRFDGDTASTPVQSTLVRVDGDERVLVLAKRKKQRAIIGLIGSDSAGWGKSFHAVTGQTSGTVVRTRIPATGADRMMLVEIQAHGFESAGPEYGVWQCYFSGSGPLSFNSAGYATSASLTPTIFSYQGLVHLWIPHLGYATSHRVRVSTTRGTKDIRDQVEEVYGGPIPAGATYQYTFPTTLLLTDKGGTIKGALTLNSGLTVNAGLSMPAGSHLNMYGGNINVRSPGAILENGFTLDRLYGVGWPCYNFGNGYLIRTDIGPAEDVMWMLDVRLNTYSAATTQGTGEIQVQGYAFGSGAAIGLTAATSTVGRRDVYAFFYSNTLHFWLPGGPYETALIRLATQLGTGGANHRILNVTNAAMPTSGVSRSVAIVPEVLGYKPQTSTSFTYSSGSTAAGAGRVLATGTITLTKPSTVFFSGNFQAITTANAAAWFDVEVVGVATHLFRVHSYGKAIHTSAAWSRGFNIAAAGTYTVRVVAHVDSGAGAMQFEDVHAEVWTF